LADPPDGEYSRAPELEDLVELCGRLNAAGVKYVLIGGFAVILHGYVRGTKDIDLLVDASRENVERVRKALSYLEDNAVAEVGDDELARYAVVRVADEIVVDLMARACGIDFEQASREGGVETVDIEGTPVPVATMRMLIRMKDTVRPSDAADVEYLRLRLSESEEK
jgi:hypothetical protein